jgi:hypothetical protein
MSAEDIIKKLDEEAESIVSSPPQETTTEEQEVQEATSVTEGLREPEATEVEIDTLETEEQDSEEQRQQRTNWKKRFINYKASTDTTVHGLRLENLNLKERLNSVMQRMTQFEKMLTEKQKDADPFEGQFTEDEVGIFGQDGLDVVKKAVKTIEEKRIKPLEEKLKQSEAQRQRDLDNQLVAERQREYDVFLGRLGSLSPNYGKLNSDQRFVAWLNEPDPGDTYTRKYYLQKAEAARDAVRVADFFNRYTSQNSKASSNLDRHITPIGTGSGVEIPGKPGNKSNIDMNFINKFYDDSARGRYKDNPAEAQKIEVQIDKYYETLLQQRSAKR